MVDPYTGLPEVELVSVDVNWQLIDTTKPLKAGAKPTPVTTGTAFGKAFDRFRLPALRRERALRDAQNRASRVAAEMIRGQLASYFIARRRRADRMVAVRPADVEATLSRIDTVRPVLLLFGPDSGLVRERARAYLAKAMDGSTDPFGLIGSMATRFPAIPVGWWMKPARWRCSVGGG